MKFTVRVLNLDEVPDSQGETFDPAGVELEDGPVWVTLGFDPQKKIGSATLKKVEGGVDAEIELENELPEGVWTPAIGGRTFGKTGNVLTKVLINSIGLSPYQNCDHRIQPLRKA